MNKEKDIEIIPSKNDIIKFKSAIEHIDKVIEKRRNDNKIPNKKTKKIRCPYCNGKAVLLKKLSVFKIRRKSLAHLENYQPYRCKKCKKEFRLKDGSLY